MKFKEYDKLYKKSIDIIWEFGIIIILIQSIGLANAIFENYKWLNIVIGIFIIIISYIITKKALKKRKEENEK